MKCPFLSNASSTNSDVTNADGSVTTTTTTVANLADCATTDCQLWNIVDAECSIKLIPGRLDALNTSVNATLTTVNSTISEISSKFTSVVGDVSSANVDIPSHKRKITKSLGKNTIVNLLKHNNIDHGDSVLNGSPSNQSCTTLLLYELSTGEDMDGNGKVFGTDFAIVNDYLKPANIPTFDDSTMVEISFAQYKAWADDDTNLIPDPLA